MKIGIFMADSNGGYPVPASKGGAVSTLVEHLVKGDNKEQLVDMDIISIYDQEAEKMSKLYPNIKFIWIRPCAFIRLLDKIIFNFVRTFLKKKKAVSFKSLASLIYCIILSAIIIFRNNYDKVILENNIPLAWAIKLSRYQGEYYYHFHNIPRINAKCKNIFEKCTGFLCVSEYVAEQISSEKNPIGPVNKHKIKVLYNCIDTKQYCPIYKQIEKDRIKKDFSVDINHKVVSFVGRLSEEKGIDKLLEAVNQIDRQDIIVLIVGSFLHNMNVMDDYQKKIYNLARCLSSKVVFTGYIPQSEVERIYQISDVVVLPSMWDEPAGLTMVEALACGASVITTNAGGIPEYMDGHAVVLKRDDQMVMNIAKCIERLLDAKDDSIKERRDYVVTHFNSDMYVFRFVDCII